MDLVVCREDFLLRISHVESSVLLGEVDRFVELLLYKDSVVGYEGDSDHCHEFAFVGGDLGDREIESALQSSNKALDDLAFVLKRSDPMEVYLDCQSANKHEIFRLSLYGRG